MRAVTKCEMMSQHLCAAKLITIGIRTVRIVAKGQNLTAVIKSKHPSHQISRWRRMTSHRAPLPCAAIEIPCKIDRYPVSNDGHPRGMSVVTTHGLRMAEAAGDVPIIVGGLGRCERHKTIYRTIGVAGQKDFRSGGEFLKDRASQPGRDSGV